MPKDVQSIAANCNLFLDRQKPRTVRDQVQEIADSPLSLIRSDGYGRGGFLAEFEAEIATLLGKEAAVFMPSGTMAQQIALRIWSDELGSRKVAFHPTCHLEIHEHKAYSELHRLEAVLVGESDRLFTVDDLSTLSENISTLLIELPQREIGGQLPSWEELNEICHFAQSRGMKLHMDGARLWECQPFFDRTYAEISAPFDSVYVSFYKVLNGLPGAALAGPADFIAEARIWQRRHGGNLQQQSPSAISAKLGLDRYLPRIPSYVQKAKEIAEALSHVESIRVVPENPPTNMMHLYLEGDPERLLNASLSLAGETGVGLFFRIGAEGKLEISIGDSALEIPTKEIKRLFAEVIRRAGE